MAELRKNPLAGRWVIFSTHRGKRPSDFHKKEEHLTPSAATDSAGTYCAFCAGHENESGADVLAFNDSNNQLNAPSWRVRVATNLYPAVSRDPKYWSSNHGAENSKGPPYEGCFFRAIGSHEVVIETPDHNVSFEDLPESHVQEVLKAFQLRMQYFREEKIFKYCQAFKNNGGAAGASMSHAHSQLIALPVVPRDVQNEIHVAKTYFNQHRRCALCDIIAKELEKNVRVIGAFNHFVVLSPYAAAFAYECWIVPLKHAANYETTNDPEIQELAKILKCMLKKLNAVFDSPPYNYTIQNAPLQEPPAVPFFHWYIRIIPHLTILAGFELATGSHVNSVFPEEVAKVLHVDDQ